MAITDISKKLVKNVSCMLTEQTAQDLADVADALEATQSEVIRYCIAKELPKLKDRARKRKREKKESESTGESQSTEQRDSKGNAI